MDDITLLVEVNSGKLTDDSIKRIQKLVDTSVLEGGGKLAPARARPTRTKMPAAPPVEETDQPAVPGSTENAVEEALKVEIKKPFAGFANFDACVLAMGREGHDAESARKICGSLQSDHEKKTKRAVVDIEKASADGVMVGYFLPEALGKMLAQDGEENEKLEDLHITLAYLGKRSELPDGAVEQIKSILQSVADAAPLLAGEVGGVGRFAASETSDGMDVVYASVDMVGLSDFREALVKGIESSTGVKVSRKHGFTPHITLAYVPPDWTTSIVRTARHPLTIDALTLAVGGERTSFPFVAGEGASKPKRQKSLTVPTDAFVEKSYWCPIVKLSEAGDEDKRLITGIVLTPDVVDAQGDVISADVIETAAHDFLAQYNVGTSLGFMHRDFDTPLELVESWVTPEPFSIGGRLIKRGTWLMTMRVPDNAIWDKVKSGKLRGFSIGGVAKVGPPSAGNQPTL